MGSKQGETYYRVLGLEQNCTAKEVKDAFLTLSKLHHPDMHSNEKNIDSHNKFVKINEAYSVLSKPGLRRSYDSTLLSNNAARTHNTFYTYRRPRGESEWTEPDPTFVWRDETIERGKRARTRARFYTYDSRSYYGVNGMNRRSNSWVASGAILFMGFGIIMHYFAFRYSNAFKLAEFEKQELYHRNLTTAKEKANKNGDETQLEKIENSFRDTDRKPF